ncbi:MAG: prepilin-type N-terminal cleavage/methylation domain-containing protein [Planctomycetaceae bacterium]|nr:prepilin-type N-terminal cleavage/methylation domain-containing protein [Planctomycetales bacterium]MCB9938248.1 prepilin-type N-terminal cleavage/methylation domain-containing protein [Planctomycetaceae bacterium]
MASSKEGRNCTSSGLMSQYNSDLQGRRGFTLLELMLALGLTTVILLAISMAVDLHLRSYDARRKQLEESQLARSILKIIADDIRNTVLEYEQDLSGLEQMISNAAAGAIAGGGASAGGGDETGVGSGDAASDDSSAALTSDLAAEASAASQDLSSVTVPAKPGIYGNQYQLQLDISRLPRFDEYQSMIATRNSTLGITDIPSDVKTVTYYVLNGDTAASASGMTATSQDILTSTDPDVVQRGLVRRQLDRAVSQYALANGLLAAADSAGEVVAAEVASIEFQYFDGIEWRYEWDTEVEGSLPVAIQIIMLLEAPSMQRLTVDQASVGTSTDLDPSALHYYRLLVPVATGQAVETAEEDTSLEAAGI